MRKRVLAPLSLVVASALVRLVGGCSIDDLELGGKACPCVAGFICDVPRNTCVPEGTDTGAISGGNERDATPGAFVVQRFGPTWRTSKSIRWDWEVSGNPDEFAEYQIVVGGSEDAVRRQDSTTGVFDRRINPELGSYGGRDPVAAGAAAKAWSVTDRHGVARKVFARLIVRDKAGRENVSEIVSADTLPENKSVILFADQIVDGSAPTPAELKRVTSDCFSNTAGCLQIANIDCGDAATCDIEMGVVGIDNKNVNGMTAETFATSFVEVAVRGGAAASAKPHADLVLTIGAPACRIDGNKCRFRSYAGWSFRPGVKEFRLVQLPLHTLQLETPAGPGRALTFDDLRSNGLRILSFTVDGAWVDGANIGLDHVHLRW